ncbi:MAG: hypothetical protein WCQ50_05770 [Spirochaetota bacterium]
MKDEEAGLFAIDGARALELAKKNTLPTFVYRLDLLEGRFRDLRAALPSRVRLAYAVKANPHPGVCGRLAALGAAFDCASEGELALVGGLGTRGERVLFAGPGKSDKEIGMALDLGARIEADGMEDLEAIERHLEARGFSGTLPISLRVHPGAGHGVAESSRIIGGAGPSAFGIDEEDLDAFLGQAHRFKRLCVSGLQVFAASNERNATRLLANHRAALAIAEAMTTRNGLAIDLIDLGGGLGIPYSTDESLLDIAALGQGLGKLLEDNAWFKGELLLEPGRWLVGPIGVYLSRVLRTKHSRGSDFAILEGGVNHLLRPALTGQSFPVTAAGVQGKKQATILAGPLCTSLDRLGTLDLPPLARGDLLVFGQAGAYGFTEAMKDFLSHPPAGELCIEG